MKNKILGHILLKLSSFPSFSNAGIKALRLLNERNVKIKEVEKVLRFDPGITANVLKLANSPFFGIPQKVGSVKQAIILLGTKRLAKLIISVCTSSLMEKRLDGYNMPSGSLWHHSIAVSSIAECIARYKKVDDTIDVFTPALLHDLGKLALSSFVEKEYERIESITQSGAPIEVAENMVLGTDHAEIGSQILRQWSFPSDIVDAVRFHHNPERLKIQSPQLDIVYIADLLFKTEVRDNRILDMSNNLSLDVMKRLGIKTEEFKLLSDHTSNILYKLSDSVATNVNSI